MNFWYYFVHGYWAKMDMLYLEPLFVFHLVSFLSLQWSSRSLFFIFCIKKFGLYSLLVLLLAPSRYFDLFICYGCCIFETVNDPALFFFNIRNIKFASCHNLFTICVDIKPSKYMSKAVSIHYLLLLLLQRLIGLL